MVGRTSVVCIATNTFVTIQIILTLLDPNGASQAVTASVTGPTIVFISWKRVNCIDRNSVITSYTVYYGPVDGTAVNVSVSGTNHLAYTAVGLTPSTNYSIEVAAVNSDGGFGPFSAPIFVRTPDLASECIAAPQLQALKRETPSYIISRPIFLGRCGSLIVHAASGCIYLKQKIAVLTLNSKETLHIVLQIHWFSMVQSFQTMVLFFWRTLENLMLNHSSA